MSWLGLNSEFFIYIYLVLISGEQSSTIIHNINTLGHFKKEIFDISSINLYGNSLHNVSHLMLIFFIFFFYDLSASEMLQLSNGEWTVPNFVLIVFILFELVLVVVCCLF